MVHTVCVYAYGTTIRVWYGYLYHMGIYYIFTVQLYSNTILFDICLRSILSLFNALCSFLPSDVLGFLHSLCGLSQSPDEQTLHRFALETGITVIYVVHVLVYNIPTYSYIVTQKLIYMQDRTRA